MSGRNRRTLIPPKDSSKPDKSPTQTKSLKKHTLFKPEYHQGTPFLKKYITSAVDENGEITRFVCSLCTGQGYCENLRNHIRIANIHLQKLTSSELKQENEQALKHLDKNSKSDSEVEFIEVLNDAVHENEMDFNLGKPSSSPKSTQIAEETLLKFEMTRFLITHNLPFLLAKDLADFIKKVGNKFNKTTIEETAIYNKQITHIAKNCLANTLQEKYLKLLEKSPFSISIDEGQDKSGKAFLAISARFFPEKTSNRPISKFLG